MHWINRHHGNLYKNGSHFGRHPNWNVCVCSCLNLCSSCVLFHVFYSLALFSPLFSRFVCLRLFHSFRIRLLPIVCNSSEFTFNLALSCSKPRDHIPTNGGNVVFIYFFRFVWRENKILMSTQFSLPLHILISTSAIKYKYAFMCFTFRLNSPYEKLVYSSGKRNENAGERNRVEREKKTN